MTIDEAIEIYEIRANTHEREAEYHRPLGYSHEAIANVVEMQAREERQIAKWLKELKERRADRKTEPQTNKDFEVTYTCSFTDCDNFKNFGFGEKCIECKRKQSEAKYKDEPQTDCGDFADRLAYERGVKHAWEVAQKVFDSTVTFYEAEDVAKQIAKTEPQTCNDCDQQRCETCVTEIGIAHSRADGKERVMTREDAIYEIKQLAVLSTNKNIERITEALNMAVEALQIVPIKMVYCKDCDNYAGEGMYCAWNVLTADMGYCHHARPKGGTDVTTDCPWG